MILVVCLDLRDGIRFNQRRQSADRCVIERILQLSQGKRLLVAAASAQLFPREQIAVSSQPLFLAGPEDACFMEDSDVLPYAHKVKKLIVFRWDKTYPADTTFPMAYFREHLRKTEETLFPGNSHTAIIQEVYER